MEPRTPRAANAGFTLIEVMAVVLIIGLLSTLVGVSVFQQVDRGRVTAAQAQISNLESVIEIYRMEQARFPTTEQGLEALVRRDTSASDSRHPFPQGGYLKGGRLPLDPWGQEYQYASPGEHNSHGYDIWSWGADGQPGGEGVDADISNWGEDRVDG
jgi:general secretion pathway protein G